MEAGGGSLGSAHSLQIQVYKRNKSCGDIFAELLAQVGCTTVPTRVGCWAEEFFLSSMQIGGGWRLENRGESIQVHSLPEYSVILASIRHVGGAMPTSCCFKDRKRKHWFLLCAATGPPNSSPTSAAHPKLARGVRQQGQPLSVLFSRDSVQTAAPTPEILLWMSSGITLQHPPPYTAIKRLEQPPHQYRQRKQTPFVPPVPSQHRLRYMSHHSSPLQSWTLQNTPTFTFPPSASSSGGRGGGKTAKHLMRLQKKLPEPTCQFSSSFVHFRSLNSRPTGSQIQWYTELVNLSGALLGVEGTH